MEKPKVLKVEREDREETMESAVIYKQQHILAPEVGGSSQHVRLVIFEGVLYICNITFCTLHDERLTEKALSINQEIIRSKIHQVQSINNLLRSLRMKLFPGGTAIKHVNSTCVIGP